MYFSPAAIAYTTMLLLLLDKNSIILSPVVNLTILKPEMKKNSLQSEIVTSNKMETPATSPLFKAPHSAVV